MHTFFSICKQGGKTELICNIEKNGITYDNYKQNIKDVHTKNHETLRAIYKTSLDKSFTKVLVDYINSSTNPSNILALLNKVKVFKYAPWADNYVEVTMASYKTDLLRDDDYKKSLVNYLKNAEFFSFSMTPDPPATHEDHIIRPEHKHPLIVNLPFTLNGYPPEQLKHSFIMDIANNIANNALIPLRTSSDIVLRIASYNIQAWKPVSAKRTHDAQGDIINTIHDILPDILLLQESRNSSNELNRLTDFDELSSCSNNRYPYDLQNVIMKNKKSTFNLTKQSSKCKSVKFDQADRSKGEDRCYTLCTVTVDKPSIGTHDILL